MEEKYITLKEAAQLSGYSPDYLGQLIRKGKLAGKQVYLNVAWMTTREALEEYLAKNNPDGPKPTLKVALKERVRRSMVAYTSGDRVILLARRVIYILVAILIILCLFLFYAFLANVFHAATAHAATGIPKVLSYQGRLFDANGNLLGGAGTSYCFKFSIFDGVATGSKLWPAGTPSIMTATVKNGVFNVGVGDTVAGGDALTYDFQATDTVYLNVDVATKIDPLCTGGSEVFETLSPRERIVASGYAINSYSVGGFVPSQNASGTEIPVLTGGDLVFGDATPNINAIGTSTLTLQGGTGTGNIQFFSANTFFTASGTLTVSSTVTANMLQATATSSQFIFQGTGATGTLSWNPTVFSALTIPNFATATDTVALTNFAQILYNKTLSSSTLNTSTINFATINSPTIVSPTAISGMTLIQNVATSGLSIFQNATGTALLISNLPTSTQSANVVSITAGNNVSGTVLFVKNFGTGNAFQVNDSSTPVFTINGSGTTLIQPSTDTTSAFILASANGSINLLTGDTLNNKIKIGRNGAAGTIPTLLGLDEKADAGDPTGFPGAMYYSSSTGQFRCDQGGTWYNCVPTNLDWQQSFFSNRWGDWTPAGIAVTTMSSTNLIPPTVNGAAAASPQAEDMYIQWTSAGATGMSGGVTSTFAQTEPRYTPRAATRIRTDTTITSRRIWFALTSANVSGFNGTGTSATAYFGLVYNSQSSTDWQCGSGDTSTSSVVDTGVSVAINTYYDLIVDATTLGQLTCKVATNGGSYVSVTKTTNIPTSTTALGIYDISTALSATPVVHRVSYVYVGGRGN